MSRSIPDRWLDYKPIGEPIKGTRFVAFKVPLSKAINENVKNIETRLDISQLLEKIPNLGLVIDLTFTTKYYDPQSFIDEGIEHVKLMIPGRIIPKAQHTNLFTKYVQDFVKKHKNTDKLIGVHCTHGVNRTGYLICHHMIKCLRVQPEDAIKDFEEARGHKIEREHYRYDLLNISQDNGAFDSPESFGRNRSSKRSPELAAYPNKSFRWEDQGVAGQHNNYNNRNDAASYRSRNGRSRFDSPNQQRSESPVSWRMREPVYSGQRLESTATWRNSGHNNQSYGQRSYNNNNNGRNSTNSFRNYNNNDSNARRDPLPSNNFESCSVMDQVYGGDDHNSRGRFRWQRPN